MSSQTLSIIRGIFLRAIAAAISAFLGAFLGGIKLHIDQIVNDQAFTEERHRFVSQNTFGRECFYGFNVTAGRGALPDVTIGRGLNQKRNLVVTAENKEEFEFYDMSPFYPPGGVPPPHTPTDSESAEPEKDKDKDFRDICLSVSSLPTHSSGYELWLFGLMAHTLAVIPESFLEQGTQY